MASESVFVVMAVEYDDDYKHVQDRSTIEGVYSQCELAYKRMYALKLSWINDYDCAENFPWQKLADLLATPRYDYVNEWVARKATCDSIKRTVKASWLQSVLVKKDESSECLEELIKLFDERAMRLYQTWEERYRFISTVYDELRPDAEYVSEAGHDCTLYECVVDA